MADFLWHKVSEKEKKEIEKQAKSIMDSFSKKLSKIDRTMPEPLIERDEGERAEGAPLAYPDKSSTKISTKGKGEKCDQEFRKIMFENAPEKNKDFIIAEKKRW